MTTKKKYYVNLDVELGKKVKHYCIDHDTDMSEYIGGLLEREMISEEEVKKVEELEEMNEK